MASPIPMFAAEGDDAYWWILCIEKYFNVWGTPEVAKLPVAVTALRGPALQWCLCWYHCHPQASWESFITPFLWRFKPEYEIVDDRKQHRKQRRHTKEHLQAELVEEVVEEDPAEPQETETFVVRVPPPKPVVQLAQTETEAMPSLEEWTSTRSTMGDTVFNNLARKPPPPKPPDSEAFTAAKCSSTRKPVAFPWLKPPDVNPTPALPPKPPDLGFQSLSVVSQISCEPTRPPPLPKPPDNSFSTRLSPSSFSWPSPPPVNIPPVSLHSQLSQNIHFVTPPPSTFTSEISSTPNLITIMPKSSNSDEQNFVDVFCLPFPACTVKPIFGFNGFYGYEQFQVNWEPVRPPPPPKPPDRTYITVVELENQLTYHKPNSTPPDLLILQDTD